VTDGSLVYAAFNGGRIVAVDFGGIVRWSWQDRQFVSKHGLAASPILYRDLLIMSFDGNGPEDVNNIGYQGWIDDRHRRQPRVSAVGQERSGGIVRGQSGDLRWPNLHPVAGYAVLRHKLAGGGPAVDVNLDACSGCLRPKRW
jgi:hypothetical protein